MHYALAGEQTAALDAVMQAYDVAAILHTSGSYKELDEACLLLCIALLDHLLHGDIYDSVIIRFLAVLGVRREDGSFHEPVSYTSYLSTLIKMAQLLVVQRAVLAVEKREVECLTDILNVMKE